MRVSRAPLIVALKADGIREQVGSIVKSQSINTDSLQI